MKAMIARFALLTLAMLASVAYAQTNPPYIAVDPPAPYSDSDKVEIVEVFSYACIHCAQFQPRIDAWRKRLDAKRVEFIYLPAPYNAADTALARGYFAAKVLGVDERTHHGVFEAVHSRGWRVQSMDDVVKLYAQLGVDADQFGKTIRDFYVDAQARRALEFMFKYKIDGTPTLIVAGKYRITAESAGNPDAMIDVADKLVARELAAQSTGTSRHPPKSGK